MVEMFFTEPTVEILFAPYEEQAMLLIEMIGRTCYQSYDKIAPGSAERFVRMIIQRGHLGLLEHVSMTARLTCSRGVADELMRHRHASYACMSSRYCDFEKKPLRFVSYLNPGTEQFSSQEDAFRETQMQYHMLRAMEIPPEVARNVLPLGMATELCATANLREWRYILDLRTRPDCHPEMQYLMGKLLAQCKERFPVLFGDIGCEGENDD